ncbi:MAG: class IV adenylate cyclase [Anaerolineales bacterium]
MKEQPTETEVKFCVRTPPPSLPQIRKYGNGNLQNILLRIWGRWLKAGGGWSLIQPRTFEVNLRFDTSKGDLMRAGRVLRLRKDDLVRLTYKDNSRQIKGALTRREIEFVANDFDSAKQFIEALGYEVVFIYEKYRTTFKYKGTQIMFDELPYGNFVEIEGKLKSLRPIAEELQLDWEKAIPASYHALFERLCKARGLKFRDLTFKNFKGIKVSPKDMMIEYADTSRS